MHGGCGQLITAEPEKLISAMFMVKAAFRCVADIMKLYSELITSF